MRHLFMKYCLYDGYRVQSNLFSSMSFTTLSIIYYLQLYLLA